VLPLCPDADPSAKSSNIDLQPAMAVLTGVADDARRGIEGGCDHIDASIVVHTAATSPRYIARGIVSQPDPAANVPLPRFRTHDGGSIAAEPRPPVADNVSLRATAISFQPSLSRSANAIPHPDMLLVSADMRLEEVTSVNYFPVFR
jgi:hypothetical protein